MYRRQAKENCELGGHDPYLDHQKFIIRSGSITPLSNKQKSEYSIRIR